MNFKKKNSIQQVIWFLFLCFKLIKYTDFRSLKPQLLNSSHKSAHQGLVLLARVFFQTFHGFWLQLSRFFKFLYSINIKIYHEELVTPNTLRKNMLLRLFVGLSKSWAILCGVNGGTDRSYRLDCAKGRNSSRKTKTSREQVKEKE